MRQQAKESILFFDMTKALGLELIFGQQVKHRFLRHTHENLCIGLLESGNRMFVCRGSGYMLAPGDIFLIPPRELHACSSEDGHNYKLMMISQDLLQTLLPVENVGSFVYHTLVLREQTLYNSLQELYQVLRSKQNIFLKQKAISLTLGEILERSTKRSSYLPPESCEAVKQAKQYLGAHYQQTVRLEALAAQAYLSPYHFLRVFSKLTGLPPHLYQQQTRIREAKKMLLSGVGLNETALLTGFTDQSHFTHVFKNLMGITPKIYLNSVTGNGKAESGTTINEEE